MELHGNKKMFSLQAQGDVNLVVAIPMIMKVVWLMGMFLGLSVMERVLVVGKMPKSRQF